MRIGLDLGPVLRYCNSRNRVGAGPAILQFSESSCGRSCDIAILGIELVPFLRYCKSKKLSPFAGLIGASVASVFQKPGIAISRDASTRFGELQYRRTGPNSIPRIAILQDRP